MQHLPRPLAPIKQYSILNTKSIGVIDPEGPEKICPLSFVVSCPSVYVCVCVYACLCELLYVCCEYVLLVVLYPFCFVMVPGVCL